MTKSATILAIAKQLSVRTAPLSRNDFAPLRARIALAYPRARGASFLWEQAEGAATLVDPLGWRAIGEICRAKKVIVFFDESDDVSALVFEDGADIARVFEECSRIEFYVTDAEATFLLCCSHEEVVVAAGAAVAALRALASHRNPS